jgi:hypothetical protein
MRKGNWVERLFAGSLIDSLNAAVEDANATLKARNQDYGALRDKYDRLKVVENEEVGRLTTELEATKAMLQDEIATTTLLKEQLEKAKGPALVKKAPSKKAEK